MNTGIYRFVLNRPPFFCLSGSHPLWLSSSWLHGCVHAVTGPSSAQPSRPDHEPAAPSCGALTPLKKVLGFWSLVWPEAVQMELGEGVGVKQKVPGSEVHGAEAEHGNSKSTVSPCQAFRAAYRAL